MVHAGGAGDVVDDLPVDGEEGGGDGVYFFAVFLFPELDYEVVVQLDDAEVGDLLDGGDLPVDVSLEHVGEGGGGVGGDQEGAEPGLGEVDGGG